MHASVRLLAAGLCAAGLASAALAQGQLSIDNYPGAATYPSTSVMGARGSGPGPSQRMEGGAGGFTAVDIARSYFFADADHDGELTRAEARRLSISTMSFEEMDRNFDGLVSRFEYEDSVR